MGRKLLTKNPSFSYHVTSRTNNREWFYIPTSEVWPIFEEKLTRANDLYETEIHAFVLMSNHFHLILSDKTGNIAPTIRYLLTEVSKAINFIAHRMNHVFGIRYKWSALRNAITYAYVYKYVLRNPVRAGIARTVEEYPMSTLHHELNGSLRIPMVERFAPLWDFIPREMKPRLEWLNVATPKEHESLIKRALHHYDFRFPDGNDYRHRLKALRQSYGVEGPESH